MILRVSETNRDIHRRLIDLLIQEMADDGLGPPPVAFCVLVMGSGGRGESFLSPDQDNGFILDDYPDEEHDRIDAWFRELAGRFVDALDTAASATATGMSWRSILCGGRRAGSGGTRWRFGSGSGRAPAPGLPTSSSTSSRMGAGGICRRIARVRDRGNCPGYGLSPRYV